MLEFLGEKLLWQFQKKGLRQYLRTLEIKTPLVLDVGCGRGRYAELFGDNYIGIDNDENKIKKASRRRSARFEVMNATRLVFPDNHFDLAFSIAVFHHLAQHEVPQAFQEMARVTKSGGHILLIDMVLPERWRFLAEPVFFFDRGAIKRNFTELKVLIKTIGLIGRYEKLSRFLTVGIAVLEFQKI